jgi:glutamine cyclotransferase
VTVVLAASCSSLSSVTSTGDDLDTQAAGDPPLPLDDSSTDQPVDSSGDEQPATDPGASTTLPNDPSSDDPASDDDAPDQSPPAGTPVVTPVVVNAFPHDTGAFTQGLELLDGVLIESLGLRGESARRRVVPTTGEVSASAPLAPELFGAGLTVVDNTIYQLTWQSGTVILADPTTLIAFDERTIDGEGWGICAVDDQRLAISNGTDEITYYDRASFQPTGSIDVTLDGAPLGNLNELECVDGRIWANVWLTSDIVAIDPSSGVVTLRVDASALVPGDLGPEDVLNGIAYNAASDTFYLTGKRWSVLYEVSLGAR